MGKTKTAFVGGEAEEIKSSEEAYKEKRAKQEAEKAKSLERSREVEGPEETRRVHVPGLKGGQRVVAIEVEPAGDILSEAEGSQHAQDSVQKQTKSPQKRGKRYDEVRGKVDRDKLYKLTEALKLVKETSISKFDGTVELTLLAKKTGLSVNVALPHSAGRERKVEVASDETIKKLQTGKIDFDVLLATAEMMPKLVAFAKILGPKGLMPNPKNGTLIKSEKEAKNFSGNTQTVKTEKDAPVIHTTVGKVSQSLDELEANTKTVLDALGGSKQLLRAYLKASMGPSVKVALN